MNFYKVYFTFVKMHFKSRVEYRGNFFAGIIANFYSYFITFISLWIITSEFGAIDGWSYEELCILYGMNQLTYAIAAMLFWSVMGVEKDIISGDLDVLLIRPIGCIQQIICKRFVDTFIGQIAVTGLFMCFAFFNLSFTWTLLKVFLFMYFLLGGVLLHSGAFILFGALSFWVKRTLILADFLYFDMRNFIQYPISIFPKVIQFFLTFVLPWAFINYYPISLFLEKKNSLGTLVFGLISPVIGVLLFLLSIKVFNLGLKKYNSCGS